MPYILKQDDDDTTTSSSSSEPRPPILAVDLDETIIQSDTEELVPGAKEALQYLKDNGWLIVIWTCRGDIDTHVPQILKRHGIPYDAINTNVLGIKDKSRKISFDAIVDNKNVDFGDGWESIVRELEKRRAGWQRKDITKAFVYRLNPTDSTESIIQEWALNSAGEAVLTKGEFEEFEYEESPCNGKAFLKSLENAVGGVYTWTVLKEC